MRRPVAIRARRGFTLIEVIVALVILSTSGLVMFAWLNQNLETARRVQEAQQRAQLQLEGLAWLAKVNPHVEPEGERAEGGLTLSWRATLVEEPRGEFDFGGALFPRWQLALYRVDAKLKRDNPAAEVQWHQLMTGAIPMSVARQRAAGGAR